MTLSASSYVFLIYNVFDAGILKKKLKREPKAAYRKISYYRNPDVSGDFLGLIRGEPEA